MAKPRPSTSRRGASVNREATPQQMIVLPARGLRASGALASPAAAFLRSLASVSQTLRGHSTGMSGLASAKTLPSLQATPGLQFKVLDSIAENGAKLVEVSPGALSALRAAQPGLRIVPVRYYRSTTERVSLLSALQASTAASTRTVEITVSSSADGTPIAGVLVVAFTDFGQRVGAQGTTNKQGRARLTLGAAKIERVYSYPERDFWPGFRRNLKATATLSLRLDPLRLDYADGLRHFHGTAPDGTGAGVTVGVIDTGVGPHPDLVVAGGANTVMGETPADYSDGDQHGTHVAGIIAARAMPPAGMRGLAPAVGLYAYRVFGAGQHGASNYHIAKAIDAASQAGCDLINLSLGMELDPNHPDPSDEALRAALEDAHEAGTLAIAAAGNDDRSPVSFPALDPLCVAVSALGRKGTFPTSSTGSADVASPYGKDKKDFIAAFSNVGPEIDLTAAGVSIISTVPGGYAAFSGTSMAAPVVTGCAAALLASKPAILAMPRGAERANALAQALAASAKSRGFKPIYEGNGMPQ